MMASDDDDAAAIAIRRPGSTADVANDDDDGETSSSPSDRARRSTTSSSATAAVVAVRIQNAVRRRAARKRAERLCESCTERVFDPKYDVYFYHNKRTGESSWTVPRMIRNKENRDTNDAARRLQRAIAAAAARRRRRRSKTGDDDESAASKHKQKRSYLNSEVQKWTCEDVATWFHSIGMGQYASKSLEFGVDGLLLVNLGAEELAELGITNKLQCKKIEISLRQHGKMHNGDDELSIGDSMSKSASSHPDKNSFEGNLPDAETNDDANGGKASAPDERGDGAREPKTSKTVLCEGEDGVSPYDGDTVKIHYTMAANTSDNVVERSRQRRNVPFEFVVGSGQVVAGIDSAIRTFNRGERSIVEVPAELGYGEQSFLPLIPPRAKLIFDIELISITTRPKFTKPWIHHYDDTN